MIDDVVVLPANAPRRADLEARGWVVVARSWGAALSADDVDRAVLIALRDRVRQTATVRRLGSDDVDAILTLDGATAEDYPGSVATQHEPLNRARATPSRTRHAIGAFTPDGGLAAMTFVDVDGNRAEIDFTVVGSGWRGAGLATAVKAASILGLVADGVQHVRTGGSGDNTAILAANAAVGFVADEQWVTLAAPAR